MDGFEKREREEEEEEPVQHYVVIEDRGWVENGVYGARLIVIAPVGGLGHSPEVHDLLAATGKKHDARSDIPPRAGYPHNQQGGTQ